VALADDSEDVADGRLGAGGETVGKQVDGGADDGLLGVGHRGVGADEGAERESGGQPAAADLETEPFGGRAGESGQRRTERAGVQRVDPVEAAADPEDLPTGGADDGGVVGLGVTEEERDGAEGHESAADPFAGAGLAGAGLAEEEDAAVRRQAGVHPGERVAADDLAPGHVAAERDAGLDAGRRHGRRRVGAGRHRAFGRDGVAPMTTAIGPRAGLPARRPHPLPSWPSAGCPSASLPSSGSEGTRPPC
jgi:hypothetical protein